MLDDLSLHILDIAENSVGAGARNVTVDLVEDRAGGWLTLSVEDDGRGMDEETCAKVVDPFYTTRTTRKVGLGIPFLRQSAELCGGSLELSSTLGVGTSLKASFRLDSIDLPPMGDVPSSIVTLLMSAPTVRWIYRHEIDGRVFLLDSVEILEILGDPEALRDPNIALWLKDYMAENVGSIEESLPE
jgi:hypothetical protein